LSADSPRKRRSRTLARELPRRIWLNQQAATTKVRNRLVTFRIIDVYHPDPDQLLRELHGEDLLQGIVVDVSQGASPETNFTIVEVDGLRSPVIVPVNHVMEVL
jgi:hypothetical protein